MDLQTMISEPSGLLADALVKGALLLAGTWLVTACLRRRASATVRHALWCFAFGGLLLLPLGAMLLPGLPLPVETSAPTQTMASERGVRLVTSSHEARMARTSFSAAKTRLQLPPTSTEGARQRDSGVVASLGWPGWPLALLILWSIGAAMLLARLGAGLMWIGWLGRRAETFGDPAWDVLHEKLENQFGMRRRTQLRWHHKVEMPMTFGVRRPVVLLPAAATRWPPSKRRLVLLHELAHARRGDALTHQIMQIGQALHWPNPLAWVATRQCVLEREKACDDDVLAAGASPTEYAGALVEVARNLLPSRRAFPITPAMAQPSELKSRIHSILDRKRLRGVLSTRGAWAMAAVALAIVLPLAALRPAAAERGASAHQAAPEPVAPAINKPQAQALQQDVKSLQQETERLNTESASLTKLGKALPTGLHQDVDDPQTDIQEQAMFALSRLPRKQSVPRLIGIAKSDASRAVREKAIFWLGQSGGPKVVAFLNRFLKSSAPARLQEKALFAVSQLPSKQAVPQLIQVARSHADPDLREKAIFWLSRHDEKRVAPFFSKLLKTAKNPGLQEHLVFAISRLPRKQSLPLLIHIAKHYPKPAIREKAIFWLGQSGDPRAIDALMDVVQRPSQEHGRQQ